MDNCLNVEMGNVPLEVGDTVTIKSWDSLVKEFGLDEDGNIKARRTFHQVAKHHCGKTYKLHIVDNDADKYGIVLFEGAGFISNFGRDIFKEKEEKMKKTNYFSVNDIVTIRSWESMEDEYGLSKKGHIKTRRPFRKDMKDLCGKSFRICVVDTLDNKYTLSDDEGKVHIAKFSRDMFSGNNYIVDKITKKFKKIVKEKPEPKILTMTGVITFPEDSIMHGIYSEVPEELAEYLKHILTTYEKDTGEDTFSINSNEGDDYDMTIAEIINLLDSGKEVTSEIQKVYDDLKLNKIFINVVLQIVHQISHLVSNSNEFCRTVNKLDPTFDLS